MIRVALLVVVLAVVLATPTPCRGEPSSPDELVWQPAIEAREGAFRFLLPVGWRVEGGVFRVNPLEVDGFGNTLYAKCDVTFLRDRGGSVRIRSLPSWHRADPPRDSPLGRLLSPGSSHNGMAVRALPKVQDYLDGVFREVHKDASLKDVRVVERRDRPDLVQRCAPRYEAANRSFVALGMAPSRLTGGSLTVDYTEGGAQYRETLWAVLVDQRATTNTWANEETIVMRAPRAEEKAWTPVFRTLLESVQINAGWLALERRGAAERFRIAFDTQQEVFRINQEIVANRQRTNERVHRQFHRYLTGQDDYLDPYTCEVVTDWTDHDYRWVSAGGEVLYTDDAFYNPNTDTRVGNRTWRRSRSVWH